MKSLMNFSSSALTRSEMKNVKGGTCMAINSSGQVKGPFNVMNNAMKAAGSGGRYCCASCGSASWLNP